MSACSSAAWGTLCMDKILLDYEAYAKAAYDKSLQFDYRKVNRKVFDVLNESLHW